MMLVIVLTFCGVVIVGAAILALKEVMMVNDYNSGKLGRIGPKPQPFPIMYESDRLAIAKSLAAYKTSFTYYPEFSAQNEIKFIDHKNNGLILKVSKVSCYSDMNGITNYKGYLYSFLKDDYLVLKQYTSLDECMRDYQQNYCLFVKKGKIADRLKSLQEDF